MKIKIPLFLVLFGFLFDTSGLITQQSTSTLLKKAQTQTQQENKAYLSCV